MNTPSGFFRLNSGDFIRGLVVAVFSGIALPILAMLQTPGFDFSTVNWDAVLILAVNGGIAGLAAYLSKNLLTADNGKVAGVL